MESWKAVPGYEGRYEVSSRGDVRSLGNAKRPNGRVLRKQYGDGYAYVTLYNGSVGRTSGSKMKVGRIVLSAFVGPKPLGKRDICHRDTNRANDEVSNLYWGTRSENMKDTVRTGRICGEQSANCRLSYRDAQTIRSSRDSGKALAARYGVSESLISMVRSGKKRAYA